MSKAVTDTYTHSPFHDWPFDIFNHDHQALIPETMTLMKNALKAAVEPMKNNAIIFGNFPAKMVRERESEFADPIFDLAIESYDDPRAIYHFTVDLIKLQSIVHPSDEMLDKAAVATSLIAESIYPLELESDANGSGVVLAVPDKQALAREHLESQLELWIAYQIRLALAKESEIARFLVDNDHVHLWERRTYVLEDSSNPGEPILKVSPLLVIQDPKAAVQARLFLSK
ncbi:hypothetical protein AX777_05960 [Sphingobium yanoikuyae]|uniref:Uncharacterized protein n=1 Tax=Sphingobium yanoikuyae TaxID=13690 RepID=A0A177JNH6_SPHYA|nr:hypothetical protein [Sphingobium yanoikuyae]OAH42782.1 hypothetical protein AX777_05960 [Sphingobium yanoikuyae]